MSSQIFSLLSASQTAFPSYCVGGRASIRKPFNVVMLESAGRYLSPQLKAQAMGKSCHTQTVKSLTLLC